MNLWEFFVEEKRTEKSKRREQVLDNSRQQQQQEYVSQQFNELEKHFCCSFIGSIHQSDSLVSDILGHPVKAPLHLPYAINALAKSVARPDWISVGLTGGVAHYARYFCIDRCRFYFSSCTCVAACLVRY